jgi:hypothetical protein
MRIIYSNKEQSFTQEEMTMFAKSIYHNIFDGLLTMVAAVPGNAAEDFTVF